MLVDLELSFVLSAEMGGECLSLDHFHLWLGGMWSRQVLIRLVELLVCGGELESVWHVVHHPDRCLVWLNCILIALLVTNSFVETLLVARISTERHRVVGILRMLLMIDLGGTPISEL